MAKEAGEKQKAENKAKAEEAMAKAAANKKPAAEKEAAKAPNKKAFEGVDSYLVDATKQVNSMTTGDGALCK